MGNVRMGVFCYSLSRLDQSALDLEAEQNEHKRKLLVVYAERLEVAQSRCAQIKVYL